MAHPTTTATSVNPYPTPQATGTSYGRSSYTRASAFGVSVRSVDLALQHRLDVRRLLCGHPHRSSPTWSAELPTLRKSWQLCRHHQPAQSLAHDGRDDEGGGVEDAANLPDFRLLLHHRAPRLPGRPIRAGKPWRAMVEVRPTRSAARPPDRCARPGSRVRWWSAARKGTRRGR